MPETEVVRGELVDYHYSPELRLCGGTVAAYDAAARRATDLLGLRLEALERAQYYWLTEADYASFWGEDSPCSARPGCAIKRRSAGRMPMLPHEIVHTIANQMNRSAAPFLSEGFAEAVTDSIGPRGEEDPRPYMTLGQTEIEDGTGYWVASRFVSYLLQVHGAERFARLYRDVPRRPELADWDRGVRASYGVSLDELVETYLAATECSADVPPMPRLECDAPAIAPDPAGNFAWTGSLDCDDPEVIGGMQPPGEPIELGDTLLELRRTLEIVEAGEYEIAAMNAEGEGRRGQLLLAECGGCAWLRRYKAVLPGARTETHWLEPGRYAVILQGFVEAEAVEFRATRR